MSDILDVFIFLKGKGRFLKFFIKILHCNLALWLPGSSVLWSCDASPRGSSSDKLLNLNNGNLSGVASKLGATLVSSKLPASTQL